MKQRRKTLTLLLMMLLLALTPLPAWAQSIVVYYQNEPITRVIDDLRRKTGYEFVYLKEVGHLAQGHAQTLPETHHHRHGAR